MSRYLGPMQFSLASVNYWDELVDYGPLVSIVSPANQLLPYMALTWATLLEGAQPPPAAA